MHAQSLQSCPTLRPLQLYPTRASWDSPGKNSGVGCHPLLQENFLTQRPLHLLPYRWILYRWATKKPIYHRSGFILSPLCMLNHLILLVTIDYWIHKPLFWGVSILDFLCRCRYLDTEINMGKEVWWTQKTRGDPWNVTYLGLVGFKRERRIKLIRGMHLFEKKSWLENNQRKNFAQFSP